MPNLVNLEALDPDLSLALTEAIEQCLAPGSILGYIRILDDALTTLQVRLNEEGITLETI